MPWLFRFVLRHRTLASLLLTSLLSLGMLSAGEMQQTRIARMLTLYAFAPIQWTVDLTRLVRNVFAENQLLRARVAELNTRLALLEESRAEYERLRSLVGITEQLPHDLLPVRVVARNPSQRMRSVVISAGGTDQLTRYMPVLDGYGVAGRIVQVLPHLSLVQLLTDPLSRTSVMTRTSRVVGILESDGASLTMRYRSYDSVSVGDTVLTSGLGGIYPKGLFVGTVARQVKEEDPLFARVQVNALANLDGMEEAFVMRLSAQWAAFRDELDSLREVQ
jgi:rod shape-determining protein MreC